MNNILNLLAHCAHRRHAEFKNNGHAVLKNSGHAVLKNSGHAVLDTASPNSMGIAGQARNDAGVGL
jgi:hypothetical protein